MIQQGTISDGGLNLPKFTGAITPEYLKDAFAKYADEKKLREVGAVQLKVDMNLAENARLAEVSLPIDQKQAKNIIGLIEGLNVAVTPSLYKYLQSSAEPQSVSALAAPVDGSQIRQEHKKAEEAAVVPRQDTQSNPGEERGSKQSSQRAQSPSRENIFTHFYDKLREAGGIIGHAATKHWPGLTVAAVLVGATTNYVAGKIGAYLASNFSGLGVAVASGFGSLAPVALGAASVYLLGSAFFKLQHFLLRKEIAAPFIGYNPQMAYDNPSEVRKKINDVIITVSKHLNQGQQGLRAIELINEMFPDQLISQIRKDGPLVLGGKTPELIELLQIKSRQDPNMPPDSHLIERYTTGGKLFRLVFGQTRSLDRELTRYLGEVIDLNVNFCRLAANRGNRDKQEYTENVNKQIQQTLGSLVTKSTIDFLEKTMKYKYGGLSIATRSCKYATIGLLGTGLANSLLNPAILQPVINFTDGIVKLTRFFS